MLKYNNVINIIGKKEYSKEIVPIITFNIHVSCFRVVLKFMKYREFFRLLILIGGFGWIDQSGVSIKTTFLICRTFHKYIPISSANYNI
jgi:hypothetical protein